MARPKSDGEIKSHQQHLLMMPSEVKAIDDWMFANKLKSRGEAIRRLCRIGMRVEAPRVQNDIWSQNGGSDIAPIVRLLSIGLGTDEAGTELADMVDRAVQMTEPLDPHEVAARKAGWRVAEDHVNYVNVPGELSIVHRDPDVSDSSYGVSAAGWALVCAEHDIEPIEAEPVEMLVVSDWLAEHLLDRGEIVHQGFAGLNVWARTVSSAELHPSSDPVLADLPDESVAPRPRDPEDQEFAP